MEVTTIVENDHAISLFKFGEHKWMQRLVMGELSFSCIGKFILQAKYNGNDIQGDKLEGVFAKLRDNDYTKIKELENEYGSDLEKIEKEGYVLFRRKSSKRRPIFCLYGYKARDIINENIDDINRIGIQQLKHVFDERMYTGFTSNESAKNVIVEDKQMEIIVLSPKAFYSNFCEAVKFLPYDRLIRKELYDNKFPCENMLFEMHPVDYEFFKQETFILPVTDKYEELFYKFPEYEYQYETRICCYNKSFDSVNDRFTLYLRPFIVGNEAYVLNQRFYLKYEVEIAKQ